MKPLFSILPILAAVYCGQGLAQEVRTAPATTIAVLPAPIRDDAPLEPLSPIEKPDFQIESTQFKLLDVVESPPMPGLPPVEGTIMLKVHSVADPRLPDPPPPTPRPLEDPELQERLSELLEAYQETHFAFVSATVYDRSRTRLTCYPGGSGEKAITVWSNIDFNHFSGIGAFEATGADGKLRRYHLLMASATRKLSRCATPSPTKISIISNP